MFKALAEFVMRGRVPAIMVALIGSWLPFVSQAALGLVTLRKGWQEGLLITLWASLPAFVGLWLGQVPVSVAVAMIAIFYVGYIASCVLRAKVSWPVTLSALVALSTLATLVVVGVSDNFVEQVSGFFRDLMTPPNGELSEEAAQFVSNWSVQSASGLVAYWIGIGALVGVLVSRWWQALLYNPGGFQQEFHALRLPMSIAIISAVTWLYAMSQGAQYTFWANVFGLPLWVSGMAMVHWLVARFKLNVAALVAMYILVPLLPKGIVILMLLALLDAGLDLRNKFKTDQPKQG